MHSWLLFYCSEQESFSVSLWEQSKTVQTKELNHLLFLQVKEVFEESPFLVPEDSVSIMDGSYEGVFQKEEKLKAKTNGRENRNE